MHIHMSRNREQSLLKLMEHIQILHIHIIIYGMYVGITEICKVGQLSVVQSG